jgi:hypothetical protein
VSETRVTTALFVAALIRQAGAAGAFAVVARHGAEQAGAVFVVVDRLDGTIDLYAPAPQTAFAAGGALDRRFVCMRERVAPAELEAALARETRFDPDLWVVGVEDRAGRPFVTIAAD